MKRRRFGNLEVSEFTFRNYVKTDNEPFPLAHVPKKKNTKKFVISLKWQGEERLPLIKWKWSRKPRWID